MYQHHFKPKNQMTVNCKKVAEAKYCHWSNIVLSRKETIGNNTKGEGKFWAKTPSYMA
jgi:hypothetical protein